MGKNLPKGGAQLFSCAALVTVGVFAASQSAQADTYTRCVQDTAPRDCVPGSGSSISLPATINLQSAGGTEGVTVFDWKVKNCNTTSGQLRGRLSIVLDNSNSATTTDPQATRATVLNQFIDEWSQTALSSGLATTDQDFPKIALTSYNGRVGVENSTTPLDDYNPSFTPSYCSQSSFPSAESLAGWNDAEVSGGTTKYSRCEYLPLVPAVAGDAAVNNLKSFATFTAQQPRGSTDFTYFFRSAATTLAEVHPHGKNVLVITDGLPNIPKNVAAATCRTTPRLKYEQIVNGTPLAGAGTKEYCVDRQALTAIEQANTEALKSDYQKINFHHVLYTENQRAYFDYDENGEPRVNPARFLVENSARTGNGKVKFSYAVDEAELKAQLNKTYAQMDKNALQYVQVQVQPAAGGQPYSYNAVSPSAPGSEFSIKFIGLTNGSNTVTVTPVYQDGRSVTQQFTVVVGGSNTSGVACNEQSTDLTVDGDPRGDVLPDGDGFYHKPDQNNDFRDYRNNDPGNLLSENDFAVVGDEQSAIRLRRLRLQGGTGNCGVVAHSARKSGQAQSLLWAILLAPLGVLGVRRRRPTRSQS